MESEILCKTSALVTALERGDAVGAVALYAEDARLLASPVGLVEGRAGIEAYWQAGIDVGLSGVTFEKQVLEQVPGGVLEVGRYAVSGDRVDCGTYLVLHVPGPGGSWRRAVEVFKADEPTSARRDVHKEES